MSISAPSVRRLNRRLLGQFSLAVLFCLVLTPVVTPALYAQSQNTGELAGNVNDQQHALVPHAKITLTDESKGTTLTTESNSKGEYTFHDVAVGTYTLTVNAPGFSSFESHHINIDADSRFRVDADLRAGDTATVQVDADAVAVDTQSAVVGQVIDNELVENLPIDGNNVVALASLLPGVTDVSAPTTFTDENGGASFNASGARNNSNLFLFDGLLWNNLYLNTGINYPNHAVLEQVSVQLNNFSAQYGRNAGSIFNVVSKSGGNLIHGEVFLHYEDSMFDAKNYFSNTKPEQHTYQFGVAIGGPIIRDKLFYEAEFQGLNGFLAVQANAETLSLAEEGLSPDGMTPLPCTAPKLVGKNCASFAGDAKAGVSPSALIVNPLFTSPIPTSFGTAPTVATSQLLSTAIAKGLTTSACISTLTSLGAGYLTNAEVPAECFDPTAQQFIKRGYIPTPNTKLGNSQYLYSSAQAAKPTHEYGGFLRLDQHINGRHSLAYRFYRTDNSDITANGGSNADTGVPTYGRDANAAYITAGSINHTFVITPSILNVATLGYKRYEYHVEPLDHTTLSTLGSTFQYPGFQSLPVVNINTRFTLGNSLNAFTHAVSENIEFVDNATWQIGRHSIQFGTDYLHNQYQNIRTNVGTFNFYGNPGFTNSQAADFIMGLVYSQSVGNVQTIAAIQNATYNYVQDTWRIKPRLTLNLGLRYELPFMWYQPHDQSATFIRGYQSTKFPNAPADIAFVGDPGVPRGLVRTDYTNLSPRLGLAYDLFGNGKTAIRAGFGTFYDAIPATVVGLTQPYTYRAFYNEAPGSFTNPLFNEPAIPANYPGGPASFPPPNSIIYPDSNFRNAYVMGFNFGIQQQVSKGAILEVNYIGRLARKLVAPEDQNPAIVDCSGPYYLSNPALYCNNLFVGSTDPAHPPNPTNAYSQRVRYPGFNYGGQGVVDLKTNTNSSYHAGQIVFRQRAYKNLTVLANYTYARTIDDISTLTLSNPFSEPDNVGFDRAASNQNSTHVFNMGYRLQLPGIRSGNSVLKGFTNNWSFQGIYNIRSGHPVNITFGGDELGTDEPGQRAYLIPGMSPTLPSNRHRIQKIDAWFNPNAFVKPAAFTASNIGRNSIVGPAYQNVEFSLSKNISENRWRQGLHSQIRVEVFNAFNTINLGQPRASYSASAAQASTFASINSGGANPNRTMQFGYIQYF